MGHSGYAGRRHADERVSGCLLRVSSCDCGAASLVVGSTADAVARGDGLAVDNADAALTALEGREHPQAWLLPTVFNLFSTPQIHTP